MKISRNKTRLMRMRDDDGNPFVPGTPQERIGLIWELTVELWSLKGENIAERRLQRHITNIVRK